jgi:cytochrome c-type biogenesis protein CcmH/NrfG
MFGSTAYGAIGAINSAINQPKENATASLESQLQAQERGYKLVLQREPENQVALKGLVEARLQMKNAQGAIAPLEKLVKLNPSQQEYKMLLAQVKKQSGSDR